jgi:hypothetical protein
MVTFGMRKVHVYILSFGNLNGIAAKCKNNVWVQTADISFGKSHPLKKWLWGVLLNLSGGNLYL